MLRHFSSVSLTYKYMYMCITVCMYIAISLHAYRAFRFYSIVIINIDFYLHKYDSFIVCGKYA